VNRSAWNISIKTFNDGISISYRIKRGLVASSERTPSETNGGRQIRSPVTVVKSSQAQDELCSGGGCDKAKQSNGVNSLAELPEPPFHYSSLEFGLHCSIP
jgi:hypothetical protein